MILSLRLKNFYSLRDDAALDFTAERISRKAQNHLQQNLIEFDGDKFVNIIGLFGSNAAGKSNIIKAIEFCRQLVLTSHLTNEGDELDYRPFKFDSDKPSEFYIDFVTGGMEYEYSFELQGGKVTAESLFYYPNKRKARIFNREKTFSYSYRKGIIARPKEVETNTGSKTLFLSRASSMNRPTAQAVYRFFLNEIIVGLGDYDVSQLTREEFDAKKPLILKAFEVSDSDITDIRMVENIPGQLHLQSFHRENPAIAFDFEREESEGTKRLFAILILMLNNLSTGATIFLDEFDLKLHLRLAEFLLDVVRATKSGQLVFTSHNPALINIEKLRKEQIVFVNKCADGNSEFVPLSDFRGIGYGTDVQKAYLMGRFDAVPYTGDMYSVLNSLISAK